MRRIRFGSAGIPLLSCLTVFALFLIFNAVYGIFPCGSNTVVWCDMEQQAVPLLMQLKQQLMRGEGIGYSALDAGGMQFYGVFFFFISNPLSFLILLTDLPADRLAVLLVIVKLSLSAGTAAVWFRCRIGNLPGVMQLLLAVMYGCSGYGLFYYQNLMWLDIMLTAPLLLCALRHLLKTGKALPYAAVLSVMIILCFYLGWMTVLFVLLYTALSVRFTVPAERRGKTAAHFFGASMLAACVTAFVWLPCLLQIMHSGRSGKLLEDLMKPVLFQHLSDKVCVLGAACIGFAVLPLIWMPLKPCTPENRRNRRLFLLLTAAALLDPVNQIWHGGSYQAFPLRWGMYPILLMLTLAGEQLSEDACIPGGTRKTAHPLLPVIGILSAAAAACVLHVFADDLLRSYVSNLWVSPEHALCMLCWCFLATVLYCWAVTGYQQRTFSLRGCAGFFSVLFLLEFSLNYSAYFGSTADSGTVISQTAALTDCFTPEEPTALLRLTRKYTHANMLGAVGYPTTAHYTSLTRADYLHGMKRLGYSSYWMEVPSSGGTLLSDALWNIRYLLGSTYDFPPWTDCICTEGGFSVAESRMTLPSAFLTDAAPESIAELPDGSRMAVQQYLAERFLGVSDAVIPYAPTALNGVTLAASESGAVCEPEHPEKGGEIRYALFLREQQALYFDIYSDNGTALHDPNSGACDITVNGVTVQTDQPSNNHNGLVFLGACEGYTVISITVHKAFSCESFGLFGMKTAPLAKAMQQAEGSVLQYRKGVYTAECNADTPKTLILSAAFDEGFTAEVNGQPAKVYRVNSCQTAVCVPEGHSRVVMRFHVRGLNAGILLGICGLTGLLLYLLLRRHLPDALCRAVYRSGEILLQLSYAAILLLVYLLPTAICIIRNVFVQ
ncbi:MAG: YfhO family protein [Oscillospiraceae bacterium]|nr:YfhO family protein [Oscillospiraceae bacterium]